MRNWPLRSQGDQVTPSELGCKGHAWADEEQTEEEAQSPQIMLLSFQAPKPVSPLQNCPDSPKHTLTNTSPLALICRSPYPSKEADAMRISEVSCPRLTLCWDWTGVRSQGTTKVGASGNLSYWSLHITSDTSVCGPR